MNATNKTLVLALLAAGLGAPAAYASCGSAFCTVNTNWTAQSALVDAGATLDLRYEHIMQDQPRAGSTAVNVGQIPAHHDEVSTSNDNLVATYSQSFANGWGVSVSAPVVKRDHLHIHNHHGAKLNEEWDFTAVGDARVVGRYQFADIGDPQAPSMNGLLFGLKLPTGAHGKANAANSIAERPMQPGSGTTDLIIGAYHHQKLMAADDSWFVQAQLQQALNSRDDFKPGAQLTADAGYSHGLSERFAALLQVNLLVKRADSGSQAEPADSGLRALFVSPGLSYNAGGNAQLYAFVQQPLYQYVRGVQLTAQRAFAAGLTLRF